MIDAPGYGYNVYGVKVKRKFCSLIYEYLKISTRVCKVYMLINAEHGVKDTDINMLEKLKKLNVKIQVKNSYFR